MHMQIFGGQRACRPREPRAQGVAPLKIILCSKLRALDIILCLTTDPYLFLYLLVTARAQEVHPTGISFSPCELFLVTL